MSEIAHISGNRQVLPHALLPEDQTRADFYALLARLYADGPDRGLLQAIAAAAPLGPPMFLDRAGSKALRLGDTWDNLRAASSLVEAEAARQEYIDLFIGVGKSEVNLHASHWLSGFMMEKPLAELRKALALLGLQRAAHVSVLEDHLCALCETMRLLIAGAPERAPGELGEQRRFFGAYIDSWFERCTGAICAHVGANYYRPVAEFTASFLALERESFDIE
ncbi:MAG: molecular chaperone TorD family protein [Burkholderiales bacterium]|nr:molecular chaperone TorD family protein [Burkholderiales bacterium]